MKIIGFSGKAGAGKDTAADYLVSKHGFVKRGFADPLYEEVADAFGVTVEWLRDRTRKEIAQGRLRLRYCLDENFFQRFATTESDANAARSPRWVLQHWGTEYRRGQDDQYWLARMAVFYQQHRLTQGVVIPDCRFENEAHWLRRFGGVLIHLQRDGVAAVGAHVSESGVEFLPGDLVIYNNNSISDFHKCIDVALASDPSARPTTVA